MSNFSKMGAFSEGMSPGFNILSYEQYRIFKVLILIAKPHFKNFHLFNKYLLNAY